MIFEVRRIDVVRAGRRWAAVVASVAALALAAGCGVEAGGAGRAYGLPPATPDGWHHITVCGTDGPVEADVPGPVIWDGPRDLRHITAPATVTFGIAYSPDQSIRYDVFAIRDVDHYGGTDRQLARRVITPFNGQPEVVRFRNVEQRGDHAIGTWDEPFYDRDYRSRFVAHDDVIAVVAVGVIDGSTRETVAQAKADLDVMWRSLRVAGVDGAPTGPCNGPSDEPG